MQRVPCWGVKCQAQRGPACLAGGESPVFLCGRGSHGSEMSTWLQWHSGPETLLLMTMAVTPIVTAGRLRAPRPLSTPSI